jgi:hypothetical protein
LEDEVVKDDKKGAEGDKGDKADKAPKGPPGKKYSKFNDEGCPTHDGAGEELNKNQLKKALKEVAAQKKKYDKWVANQSK